MDYSLAFYTVGEIALGLLVICLYLLYHLRNLKKLIKQLEEKVLSLRETIKSTKEAARKLVKEARDSIVEVSYVDLIEKQIDQTKTFHSQQSPDKDIILDLDTEVSVERQAAALRHAFLIGEKEAAYAGSEEEPSWDVIKLKLSQVISFYEHAFKSTEEPPREAEPDVDEPIDEQPVAEAPPVEAAAPAPSAVDTEELDRLQDELESYKKRVANLEKFKKLFFDMEAKWQEAHNEASEHYAKLQRLGNETGNAELGELLDGYQGAYNSVNEFFNEHGDGDANEAAAQEASPAAGKSSVFTQKEEVERLRSMMVNQHKIIEELKLKLDDAKSAEEKEAVIKQLTGELDKQERFLLESETCINLLEEELSSTRKESIALAEEIARLKSDAAAAETAEAPAPTSNNAIDKAAAIEDTDVAEMISGFESESKDMLQTISLLEQENMLLKRDFEAAKSEAGSESADAELQDLRSQLSETQQELHSLQSQHLELEERYIELKASSM